ncbi:acyl carrier protein [Christensenellaceae bacterium OttesenSCG-928-K19]|nr:acyl carrier protein [Christensenellaceae bacterium OttesenSCG-928-K19]
MVDFSIVQQLLATTCPHDPEEITLDKHLVSDLDIDSFGLMEMVIAFEKEFKIEIPDRDLRLFNTVEDVVRYIEEKQMKISLVQA